MLWIRRLFELTYRECSIFALSSGSVPAAIAVVRVSGKQSKTCLQEITRREKFVARKLFYTKLYDKEGGLIDRAMAVFLPGPSTYTGEDIAEFFVHGSQAVVDCLCQTLLGFENVRPAKAGEFTKRAFFNSKMSLHEVESLSFLLSSRTQLQRKLALHSKGIGDEMKAFRSELVDLLCSVEASIDFAEDVSFQWDSVIAQIRFLLKQLSDIQHRVTRGSLINNGVRVAIIGRTNAGKSSLLNRIAERNVAIVSDVEGTTRDAIEVQVELESVPVIFIDTAGIRAAESSLEAEGISRTLARAEEADLVLLVTDLSVVRNLADEVNFILNECPLQKDIRLIVVCNKCDLIEKRIDVQLPWKVVYTSCVVDGGTDALVEAISREVKDLCSGEGSNALLSRTRHRFLLSEIISLLEQAKEVRDIGIAAQFIREAVELTGEISGTIVNEEVLDRIFSSFCIGK